MTNYHIFPLVGPIFGTAYPVTSPLLEQVVLPGLTEEISPEVQEWLPVPVAPGSNKEKIGPTKGKIG